MVAGCPPGDGELQRLPMGVPGEGLTSQRNPTQQPGSRAGWGQPEAAPALDIGHLPGD